MAHLDTLTVMSKLKEKLAAMQWESTPLFDKVEYYTSTNLLQALEELRVFKNRVCLIIPGDDDFANDLSGRSMTTTVDRHIHLLFADRDYGKRQNAATGDNDTPGVVKMKDMVADALIGKNLDTRFCLVKPVTGGPLEIAGKTREDVAGREAWEFELAVECGQLLTQH